MAKVRYAVVGLGHIAQAAVLPAFENAGNSELVALVSGDREKLDALKGRYPVAHAVSYEGYDELLASGEVDAAFLAVPNHLHLEYTERTARRGVHVLCEKPMAVTVEECERMIEVCDAHDVRLMIAYRLHFERANLRAVRRVLDGELGELRYFSSVFSQDVQEGDIRLHPIEKGGGSVYDIGTYCINAARYLFRAEPIEVSAMMVRGEDPRFADNDLATTAILRFPGDRLAQFTTSAGAFKTSSYRVVGTRGSLRMEPAYSYAVQQVIELQIGDESEIETVAPSDQFGPELVYFSDCVLQGRRPEPDGREGLTDVRIVQAVYESARAGGRPVRIEPSSPSRRPVPDQEINRPPVDKPEEVKAGSPSKKKS